MTRVAAMLFKQNWFGILLYLRIDDDFTSHMHAARSNIHELTSKIDISNRTYVSAFKKVTTGKKIRAFRVHLASKIFTKTVRRIRQIGMRNR